MDRVVQYGALAASKFFMNVLNTTRVHNRHHLERALYHRPPGQPLITFSNHTSTLDDPLILSCMTPFFPSYSSPTSNCNRKGLFRYSLGAEEVCLGGSALHRWFFIKAGRVIPVRRGEGPFQPAMDTAIHLLCTQAIWLHIFVEGKVNPHPSLHTTNDEKKSRNLLTPIRHGIARLIMETSPRPLLLPFIHTGMERVKPFHAFFPRIFQNVDVYFGEPIDSGKLVNRIPPASDPAIYFALPKYLESILLSLDPNKLT